jgi:transcriptional regulator with XRE-family HTH domain
MSAAAIEAGLSKSLVTKWKANKVEVPSPDVLKKLSVYFNLPVSELLGEEDQKENPTAQMGSEVDEVTIELMDIIQNGSDEDRQDLLDVYKMLKRRTTKKG